ncbi:unnamed protein product [Lactuca virosa]|uniref:Uncharacterized protein n=1 Tax=Lactuca virosa TaxID=75947 RepID=A0AAU9LGB1_9ASTR|nr:unnamed protein product [Lactuca virosa]
MAVEIDGGCRRIHRERGKGRWKKGKMRALVSCLLCGPSSDITTSTNVLLTRYSCSWWFDFDQCRQKEGIPA